MPSGLTPVFLGADLNCYSFARAFHEAYGVISYAFGRYAMAPTKYSKIIRFTVVPDLDDETTMMRVLTEFAQRHEGERLYLFGCTDDYAAMIIRRKAQLPSYIAPGPAEDLYSKLQKKADFYSLCDRFRVPYPKTVAIQTPVRESDIGEAALGFRYPVIVKPSSSVDYWKTPFEGMKKVYLCDSAQQACAVIEKIYGSGYRDKVLLQEYVPGPDSAMRVLTTFSDQYGRVRAMCLGHTMVEEHTPKGLGNHAAIVTQPVQDFPLALKLRDLLESCGYTGFANFDIKCAPDGSASVFEINLRQGRSNYYMTGSGLNLAKLAVEKWSDGGVVCQCAEAPHFWHHVPARIAYRYTQDKALVHRAEALKKEGKSSCPLVYKADLRGNPMRVLMVAAQQFRQFKKFRRYYPIEPR